MMFSGIVGQDKAIRLLGRALQSGRLAHAYLFAGPAGVGKMTAAMAMAASLFCLTRPRQEPCGTCGGCIKFRSGNHPDFLLVNPDGAAIKIDQIRELKKKLAFPPFEAGQRIVVLDDTQTMRREAANSLLKVLEEPPPDNLLLLIAAESEPLLPTIVSRCQVIPFQQLSIALAADVLQHLDPELDREEALVRAGLADGAPGQALAMDIDGVLAARHEIIRGLLTKPPTDAETVERALALAVLAAELQNRLPALLDLLRIFFKQTLIASLAEGRADGLGAEAAEEVILARERWNLAQLSDKVQAIDYAQRTLERNCNRALVCDVLLLKLFGSESGHAM